MNDFEQIIGKVTEQQVKKIPVVETNQGYNLSDTDRNLLFLTSTAEAPFLTIEKPNTPEQELFKVRHIAENVVADHIDMIDDPIEYAITCQSLMVSLVPDFDGSKPREEIETCINSNREFIGANPRFSRLLEEYGLTVNDVLKVGLAGGILHAIEDYFYKKYIGASDSKIETEEDKQLATEYPGIDPHLATILKKNGVTYADHFLHAGVSVHTGQGIDQGSVTQLLSLLDASGKTPNPQYLEHITILENTYVSGFGFFIPDLKSLVLKFPIGTPVNSQVSEVFANYIHEARHARQPRLLGIVAELDAYMEQVEVLEELQSRHPTDKTLQSFIPERQSITREFMLANNELTHKLMSISDPYEKARIHADHNVRSAQQFLDELLANKISVGNPPFQVLA